MIRHTVGYVVFVIVLACSMTGLSIADTPDLEEIKCVISGAPVAADATSELDGYTVYFCCGKCVKAFNKDKGKFAAKAFHQAVATKQAKQDTCPKSGRGLNPEVVLVVGGVDVGFCCNGCKGWAEKLPEDDRITKLFNRDVFEKNFSTTKK